MEETQDSKAFQFAFIGDMPYGIPAGASAPKFGRLVEEIKEDDRLRWVLHAGDVKGESTDCTEEIFRDRVDRFNAFDKPVIVTPGDNDWTDCHRSGSGDWDPLQRLAVFREVFFSEPGRTLGDASMAVTSQAEQSAYEAFPENVRWTHQGVVFATIHIVGSQNATNDFPGRDEGDEAEVTRRTEAAITWLNETFDRAEKSGAPGIFLMIHANPVRGRFNQPGEINDAFLPLLAALEERVRALGKPVVLAHGDTHYFRVDKPFLPRVKESTDEVGASLLSNFTRVESFGVPQIHWVRVTVNPSEPEVFSFEQEIIEQN